MCSAAVLANGPKTACLTSSTTMFSEIYRDCANAFSLWPLLLYVIIQISVNLNLMAVCHGEAHWAGVGEHLFTKHTAAGSVLSEVRDSTVAGDQLTWSLLPCPLVACHIRKSWCLTSVLMQGGGQKPHFQFYLWWVTSVYEEALRLWRKKLWKSHYIPDAGLWASTFILKVC